MGADPPRARGRGRCAAATAATGGSTSPRGPARRTGSATSPEPLDEARGYAELVRRWLGTFGPGTAADLQWWLGSTKTAVTRALADLEAVEVALDDGTTGWLLPDDTEETGPVEPWAALLPTLDPTVMGWKARGFYLDPAHVPFLFDTNGNAGTTAWWDGRIVGCWVQDDEGVVRLSLLEDVGPDGLRRARARGAAAHRLARRHRDRQRLRLAADEAGAAPLAGQPAGRSATTGSSNQKTDPPPSRSSTPIVPPCASTIRRQVARPMPDALDGLVEAGQRREDPLPLVGGDAPAAVAHLDRGGVRRAACAADLDLAARSPSTGELRRVVDQVHQHRAQLGGVTAHARQRLDA